MEWKCIFCHGAYQSRKTGLIQISDDNIILLVQLSAMKSKLAIFQPFLANCARTQSSLLESRLARSHVIAIHLLNFLKKVIESPDIIKLGVNIRGKFAVATIYTNALTLTQETARNCSTTTEFSPQTS